MKGKLTTKQQRFVDLYDGNATDAARKAGFKNPERSGKDMTRNKRVMAKVQNREKSRTKTAIASREQRQQFWSTMMVTAEKDSDRLKASELSGRSEADFTDKHLVEGKNIQVTIKQYGYKSDSTK